MTIHTGIILGLAIFAVVLALGAARLALLLFDTASRLDEERWMRQQAEGRLSTIQRILRLVPPKAAPPEPPEGGFYRAPGRTVLPPPMRAAPLARIDLASHKK